MACNIPNRSSISFFVNGHLERVRSVASAFRLRRESTAAGTGAEARKYRDLFLPLPTIPCGTSGLNTRPRSHW